MRFRWSLIALPLFFPFRQDLSGLSPAPRRTNNLSSLVCLLTQCQLCLVWPGKKMRRLKKLVTSSKIDDEDVWHRQLKAIATRPGIPLAGGGSRNHRLFDNLGELQKATDILLGRWKDSLRRPFSETELDQKILQLVEKHVVEHKSPREIAVLACGHVSSTALAVELLTLLQVLDCSQYLTFLQNSSDIFKRDGIISEGEREVATNLLVLLSGSSDSEDTPSQLDNRMVAFGHIIFNLQHLANSSLLPTALVNNIIASSSFRNKLTPYICKLRTQRRYQMVYDRVSWLNTSFTSLPDAVRAFCIEVLDTNLPSWSLYEHWRPDYDRLCRWENSPLTEAQRRELLFILDLEGPDAIGGRGNTLRRAISASIPAELLDCLVIDLDHAIETGSAAVDLYISRLVDQLVTRRDSLAALLETPMMAGAHWSSSTILSLSRAFNQGIALLDRMEAFSTALWKLTAIFRPADQPALARIAKAAQETVVAAQTVFSTQLERDGVGEAYGVALFNMFAAARNSYWLHPRLSQGFVSMLEETAFKDVITRDLLETAFECFEDSRSGSDRKSAIELHSFRLLLGRQALTETDRRSLIHVPDDLRFWASRPGTDRADLAALIARIETVSHALYVACLGQMLVEEDLMIRDLVPSFRLGGLEGIQVLARHFVRRRDLGLPVHDCWLTLLLCMIETQSVPSLRDLATAMQERQFLDFVGNLHGLVGIDNAALESQGGPMTRRTLTWWADLLGKYRPALEFLLGPDDGGGPGQTRAFRWFFFEGTEAVRRLLELCREPTSLGEPERILVSCLNADGSNVSDISHCLERMLELSSEQSRKLCERLILRSRAWPGDALAGLHRSLQSSSTLTHEDKLAMKMIGDTIGIEPTTEEDLLVMAFDQLSQEYDHFTMEARNLEALRTQLQFHDPEYTAALLDRIGIHSDGKSSRVADPNVPEALLDVVEVIDRGVYEICFALTGLSELQQRARGAPKAWRAMVIRVSHWQRFCIHPAGGNDSSGSGDHVGWDSRRERPCRGTCGIELNYFVYGLAGMVHAVLQSPRVSLQSIHDAAAAFITDPPSRCIVCHAGQTPKRWRPTTCSQACLAALFSIPPRLYVHFLPLDSLAVDLLLTSLYSASASPDLFTAKFLSACPIQPTQVPAVIDSFPPLSDVDTGSDIQQILGTADRHSVDASLASQRETLLVWLLLSFQGFIASTPSNRRIPSMPHTLQLSVLDLNHRPGFDRPLHNESSTPHTNTNTNVVFHGTHPSRFLSIFRDGLCVMSGTPGQINGAAQGAGVYCGDDPGTSLPYCGKTGNAWRNSRLKNRRLLLACEMRGYTAPGRDKIHVIKDPAGQAGLAVRWIFLLPEDRRFQCPERRHVETGLMSGFRWIREGM